MINKKRSLKHLIFMKLNSLPVFMLSSFGHAGIDWTHSLLDSHKDIIIMPAFSFFRTLYKIEKINKIKLNKLKDAKYAAKILTEIFFNDVSYKVKRRKILFNDEQKKIFEKSIIEFYTTNDMQIIQKLFFSIHYAFCNTHKIDISQKKCIVIHEHVSWHYEKYKKNFDAKAILIFRDPKAVLGGGILKMQNVNPSKKVSSFQMDTMLLHMVSAFNITNDKYNTGKFFILENEKMHNNLNTEMLKLSKWMNIDFNESMLRQSFMGNDWLGESSYLAKDELHKPPPENYYEPDEVKKRWKSIISKEETKIIEIIFRKFIKKFKYEFEYKLGTLDIIFGYFFFLTRYQFQEKYFVNKYLIILRNILRRICILSIKEKTLLLFNFK